MNKWRSLCYGSPFPGQNKICLERNAETKNEDTLFFCLVIEKSYWDPQTCQVMRRKKVKQLAYDHPSPIIVGTSQGIKMAGDQGYCACEYVDNWVFWQID